MISTRGNSGFFCKAAFLSALFSALAINLFSQSTETVAITTYYPSPHGVYKTLRLYPGTDAVFNAVCTNKGEMSYSSTDDELYICSKNPANPAQNTWQQLGQNLWMLDSVNNFLYPEDNDWNVGIGTTTPTSKLHVAGGDLTVQTGQGIVLGGRKKTTWPPGTRTAIDAHVYDDFRVVQYFCPPNYPVACGLETRSSENSRKEDVIRVIYCCQ